MKLLQLQVLRGLAALFVVLFHAQSICPSHGASASHFSAFMGRFGSYGVDLFFVLSGFIIRYSEPAQGHAAQAFLWRRFCRVAPVYWLLTLLAVCLALTSGEAARVPELAHALKSFGFLAFSDGRQPLLYVGWSLEFEMFFYLATFAFLRGSCSPWRALVVTLSGLSLLGSALELAGVGELRNVREFFLDPLVLEFALGVLLAGHFRRGSFDRVAAGALATALVAVLAVRWGAHGGRVIVAGLPAALLLTACVELERRGTLRAPRFLVTLGDASYSTYLLQVFLLSAFAKLGRALLGSPHADTLIVLATVGTVACGVLFHHAIEKPLGRFVQRLARPMERPVPVT